MRRIFIVIVLIVSGLLVPQTSFIYAQSGGTTYTSSPTHGTKVYLSPAKHSPENTGCDNYAESSGARSIALAAKNYLVARGYIVRVGAGDFQQNTNDSNAWQPHVHIPIHSNARTTWDCASSNPQNGGSWMMWETGSSADENLANYILPQLSPASPGTDDRGGTDEALSGRQLLELRGTNATAAYVEAAFHTYGLDEDWLRSSSTVGNKIAAGIDNYFGTPRCGVNRACPQRVTSIDTPAAASEPATSDADPVTIKGEAFPQLQVALEQILGGPAEAGRESWFSNKTAGTLRSVSLTSDGTVVVDVTNWPQLIPDAATSAGSALLFSELNGLIFQFPNVNAIVYQLDGSCEAFAIWQESICAPVTRSTWDIFRASQ